MPTVDHASMRASGVLCDRAAWVLSVVSWHAVVVVCLSCCQSCRVLSMPPALPVVVLSLWQYLPIDRRPPRWVSVNHRSVIYRNPH